MRNNTKEAREASRAAQFAYLIKNGYEQTDYKNLVVFAHPTELLLKSFWGTAANHTDFLRYRTAEQMNNKIVELKATADRREAWKAEQKEKNKGKSSSHAAASAAIKAELAKAFPHVKFSVRSSSFAGGNSVDISWTDGATVEQVEAISGKYQYGSFNGMEDLYEYTNTREDIPQVKYVSEYREVSQAIKDEVKAQLMNLKKYSEEQLNDWRSAPDEEAQKILYDTEIPATYTGLRVIVNPDSKKYDDYFCIVFDGVQQVEAKTEQAAERPASVEVEEGKIKVIKYSERSIAVIGDTFPIKDKLKALGGKFNKFLSCGAGWVFPSDKAEEIRSAFTRTEEPQQEAAETEQPDFFGEVCKMIDNEAKQPETVETFTNLEDMETAAKSGKVISLLNMFELVNAK